MLFNSLKFLLIFPMIFGIHWAIPAKYNQWRKLFLIFASYLLYIYFKPAYALVLLGVTLVTFYGGLFIEHEGTARKKHLIWLLTVLALLPLLVFKYYNFLNNSVSEGLGAIGLMFTLPGLNWAVPVGISFFTFQAVGYLLDVFHERIKAEKDIIDYLLFVSFFPQIASGPISKADELLPQIKRERSFDYNQAVSGLKYLLWGMFLKVVIADRAGIYVDTVFGSFEKFSGLGCMLASVLYSVQIYADFAGYSLMAVGIGKTLGFSLIDNFNRPYFAATVTEFWKRWHISLTRWLTQHVYLPLGGSRCSKTHNYWNILVTFLVSGIWHGANWTFIIWGVLHGICQIIEKAFGWNKKNYKGAGRLTRIILTFIIVTLAWTIFRSPSIADALAYFIRFGSTSGELVAQGSGSTLTYTIIGIIPLIVFELLCEYFPYAYNWLCKKQWLRWCAYLMVFTMMMLTGVFDGSSFIYVSF
ncbi:MAG: MBOAT family protein [Bacteroidaceae bacterium]|nr:MBOAT family protein [Bacteroidaceae bacterium]